MLLSHLNVLWFIFIFFISYFAAIPRLSPCPCITYYIVTIVFRSRYLNSERREHGYGDDPKSNKTVNELN